MVGEFIHKPVCLALRVKRRSREATGEIGGRAMRSLMDPFRHRAIPLQERRRTRAPVVFQNIGFRGATYTVTVQFWVPNNPPRVHVVDVHTEAFEVTLFAEDAERLTEELRERNLASPEILEAYEYMETPTWADAMYLEGDLPARTSEMAVITLEVEEGIREFLAVFTIDCSDRWISSQTFAQLVSVLA